MTPNFANPIVCKAKPTPTNEAKKSSEKIIGCQFSIVKINNKSLPVRKHQPSLGENSKEILEEMGYNKKEIKKIIDLNKK